MMASTSANLPASSSSQSTQSSQPTTTADTSVAESLLEKNRRRCLICYETYTEATFIGQGLVPVKDLAFKFSRCMDVVIPGKFYSFGNFYFCQGCLAKLNALEDAYEEFSEIERKFNEVRLGVAREVVESIKRSNYLDSNLSYGNAFDATRAQIFTRWNIRLRNRLAPTVEVNACQANDAKQPAIDTAESLVMDQANPNQQTIFKRKASLQSLPRHTKGNTSILRRLSSSTSTAIAADPSDLIQQTNTESTIVISQVVSLSGQSAQTQRTGSRTTSVRKSKAKQKGPHLTESGIGPEKTRVYTSNKIDRQTAAFAAQAIVSRPQVKLRKVISNPLQHSINGDISSSPSFQLLRPLNNSIQKGDKPQGASNGFRLKKSETGEVSEVVLPNNQTKKIDRILEHGKDIFSVCWRDDTGETVSKCFKLKLKPGQETSNLSNRPTLKSPSPPRLERMDEPSTRIEDLGSKTIIQLEQDKRLLIRGKSNVGFQNKIATSSTSKVTKKPSQGSAQNSSMSHSVAAKRVQISGRSGRQIKRPYEDSSTWVSGGEIDKLVEDAVDTSGRKTRAKTPRKSDEKEKISPLSKPKNGRHSNGSTTEAKSDKTRLEYSKGTNKREQRLAYQRKADDNCIRCPHPGCYFGVYSLELFAKHQLTAHGVRQLFSCVRCSQVFGNMTSLKEHQKAQIQEEETACTVCNETFGWVCAMQVHMKIHESTEISCGMCGVLLNSYEELCEHQEQIHSNPTVPANE